MVPRNVMTTGAEMGVCAGGIHPTEAVPDTWLRQEIARPRRLGCKLLAPLADQHAVRQQNGVPQHYNAPEIKIL